jgi:protein subunit release factor A
MARKTEKDIKKDLIKTHLDAINDEIFEITEDLNNKIFSSEEKFEDWNKRSNEIKKLVKNSQEAHEIRDYLDNMLANIDQKKLDEFEDQEED